MSFADFLTNKEWYDNSTIATVIACPRKGFYSSVLNGGLEAGVGPGADFGTCLHGAVAAYYAWWGRDTESRRRAIAFRTLSALHETIFTGPVRDTLTTKHTIESALSIMDHYCDFYLPEDHLFKPIEIELAGAVEIVPQAGDPVDFIDSFWYVFRIDRIVERLSQHDNWITELKTTTGGVDREILKLCLSRQPRGYLYCARQFPSLSFTGVLADVIGVMARTLECKRAFYPKPLSDSQSWRAQTIQIVQDWRRRKAQVNWGEPPLDVYYQQTGECLAYGKCAFWDLCQPGGLNNFNLAKFKPNTWNPLALIDAPLPDVEKATVIESGMVKESIKL